MPNSSGRYRGTELQRVEAQHRTAVGRLVMLHRWMSADDKRWLLERFPELAATLTHLDRCDDQPALLTVGTRTQDVGLGASDSGAR
jgi:hypothetical protein